MGTPDYTRHEDYWLAWRCRTSFTLREAAALLSGILPGDLDGNSIDLEFRRSYDAFIGLFLNAVEDGRLHVKTKEHECHPIQMSKEAPGAFDYVEPEFASEEYVESSLINYWLPCPCKTEAVVTAQELERFAVGEGLHTMFFSIDPLAEGSATEQPFMNRQNRRYAPKLAAAVAAWQAVAKTFDPNAGKSPKESLLAWVTANATKFGVKKGNRLAYREIAKVANWRLTGGANKTPNRKLLGKGK